MVELGKLREVNLTAKGSQGRGVCSSYDAPQLLSLHLFGFRRDGLEQFIIDIPLL